MTDGAVAVGSGCDGNALPGSEDALEQFQMRPTDLGNERLPCRTALGEDLLLVLDVGLDCRPFFGDG